MKEEKKHAVRQCPRLGHPIPFSYCLKDGEEGLPCWKVVDCWWEYFDVLGYLKEHYSEAELKKLLQTRPKPKINSIVELIEQVKNRQRP